MIKLVLTAILFGFLGYIIFMSIFTFDCFNRSNFWNDKGLFIDSWDYNPYECDYPPIDNNFKGWSNG